MKIPKKEYISDITLTYSINNHEAKNKEHYKELIKLQYKDLYNIDLYDSEITNIEEVKNES